VGQLLWKISDNNHQGGNRPLKVFTMLEIAGLLAATFAVLHYSQVFTPIYSPADVDPYSDILAENGKWYRGPPSLIVESSA